MSGGNEGGGCDHAARGERGGASVKAAKSGKTAKPARSVSLSVVGATSADARKPIKMGSTKMGKWRTLVLVLDRKSVV